MRELDLADLIGIGDHLALKLLARDLLNLLDLGELLLADDGGRDAVLACAASTARAVDIDLNVIWEVVVDDMGKVMNINATGCDVGCHENLEVLHLEALHDHVTLNLREVTMEGVSIISVSDKLLGDILSLLAGAAEDDGVDVGNHIDDALESEVTIRGADEIIVVLDSVGALIGAANLNLDGVLHVVACDLSDEGGHGGREEECLTGLRSLIENGLEVILEAHVEHLVSLVEDEPTDLINLEDTALNEVDHATGGAYNDLRVRAQLLDLLADV